MSTATKQDSRIERIVRTFLASEYFAHWQAEQIEAGSYSRLEDRQDRYQRCAEAAEDGADGSTHREHIQDMRDAFGDWLRDKDRRRRAGGNWAVFAEYPYRLEAGAERHFDRLEQWHTDHGTIDQEVG